MAPGSVLTFFSFAFLLHAAFSLVEHGNNRLEGNTVFSNYPRSASENLTTDNVTGLPSTELRSLVDVSDEGYDEINSSHSIPPMPKTIQETVKDLAADIEKVKTAVFDLIVEQRSQMKQPTSQCGGLIVLPGLDHELHYRIPEGVQSVSCVWVLSARYSCQIHIINAPNRLTYFDSNFQLHVATNITLTNLSPSKLGLGEGVTLEFNPYNSYALLFFNAKKMIEGSYGFHVKISQTNVHQAFPPLVYTPTLKFITPQGTNGTFQHPSGGRSQYGPHETVFVIGRVPDGKSLNWVLNCHMLHFEFLSINWLHYSAPFGYGWTGLGRINGLSIPEGSSYVLTYISTTAVNKGGFKFEYAYTDY